MPVFDYIVTRSNVKLDLGLGTVVVPQGVRLHGDHVVSWGRGVADRLADAKVLAPVPHDSGAVFFGPTGPSDFGETPEAPVVKDEAVPDGAEVFGEVAYPRHTGFGRYELGDGSSVKGKDAAIKAQAELEVGVGAGA